MLWLKQKKHRNTATGTITKGTSRGMGAMLRGGDFHHLLGENYAFNAWKQS
jgi:hypothetical protein